MLTNPSNEFEYEELKGASDEIEPVCSSQNPPVSPFTPKSFPPSSDSAKDTQSYYQKMEISWESAFLLSSPFATPAIAPFPLPL